MSGKQAQPTVQLSGGPRVSSEYVERLSRILLSFCKGMHLILAKDHTFQIKLEDLERVLQKTLDSEDITGFGKEVLEQFDHKKMEDSFRVLEREGLVDVVRELTLTIKEIIEPTGNFDNSLDQFIADIQSTDNLLDMRSIKDKIVQSTRKMQDQVKSLKQDLESTRTLCATLETRLEESETRAIIDSLTRTLNRTAYDMRIAQVVKEFQRFKDPCTLAVLDIDHFKSINDKFGHQSGDNALASIAATVKECIRDSDVLFRYGGEEFVILFHKTDLMGSVMVAEKIRERVAASRTHLVNDVYADKSKRVKVTVSIGLAEIKPEDGAESWFQRADEAMYRSKDKGRDRVTTAPKNA